MSYTQNTAADSHDFCSILRVLFEAFLRLLPATVLLCMTQKSYCTFFVHNHAARHDMTIKKYASK